MNLRFPPPPVPRYLRVRAAGQATAPDYTGWIALAVVFAGFVGYEVLKHGVKQYAR